MTPQRNTQAHANRKSGSVTNVVVTPVVGVATTFSPGDHAHGHGNQTDPNLHALVIAAGNAGFMSGSDKTKLDGLSASGFSPSTALQLYDDFVSGNEDTDEFGSLGWRISKTGTGNVFARIDGESGHPGIVRISGGSAGAGRSCGHLGQSGAQNMIVGGGEIIFESVMRFNGTPANQEMVVFGVGDNPNISGDQDDGVYFQFLAADSNWFLVSASGGVRTRVDTLKTIVATEWVRFTFTINSAGTSIQAAINGVDAGSAITTNIPSLPISPLFKADGNGVSADTSDFDYFYISQTLSR